MVREPDARLFPSSRAEMEKWVDDIQMAIDLAEKSSGPTPEFLASSPPDNSKWGGRPSHCF